MFSENRRRIGIAILILAALVVVYSTLMAFTPLTSAQQPLFVTNTPPPPDPLDIRIDAPYEQYALRLWNEQELIEVLVSQLERLIDGETEQQDAIRLTLHELMTRFPGAPSRLEQRKRILNLMVDAPRGTVDMRDIVRPYIVSELNNRSTEFTPEIENTFTVDNFLIQTSPFNLNGDRLADSLIAVRYPADAVTTSEILYEDFFIGQGIPGDGYLLVPSAPKLPAAPYDAIHDVNLLYATDINNDGLDEIALTLNTGQLNQELLIYGFRTNQLSSIVQSGGRILFGEMPSLTQSSGDIRVMSLRLESEKWNCVSQLPITWRYSANLYREEIAMGAMYTHQDTVGCAMLEAEPVFERPAQQGIDMISSVIESPMLESTGSDRAGIALAMFYMLNEQPRFAEETISGLLEQTSGNAWLAGQIDAFALAAGSPTFSPVQVCAALIRENANGACDVDQVLRQVFEEIALVRDADLVVQLENLGLPVRETFTLSSIGRADRIAVNFDLTGASWWAFARDPMNNMFYIPEIIEPPVQIVETAPLVDVVEPPPAAYVALFNGSDMAALTVLDNARRDAPSAPLSPEARFMRALILDLTNNRQDARRAYFDLWSELPGTTWGQLAGVHLEKRG